MDSNALEILFKCQSIPCVFVCRVIKIFLDTLSFSDISLRANAYPRSIVKT